MDTWLEKYRPKLLTEYLDYDTRYAKFLNPWIEAYNSRRQPDQSYIMHRPFVLLVGEPGVGKTTLAHCLFNTHNYFINECNASETRTKKGLNETIRTGKRVAGRGFRLQNVGVIMDEIDGLSINESNGINVLLDIVLLKLNSRYDKPADEGLGQTYHPRYPVIFTANNIKERKFMKLLDMSIIIKVTAPSHESLIKLATKINTEENIGLLSHEIKNIVVSLGSVSDYRIVIQQIWRIHHARMALSTQSPQPMPIQSPISSTSSSSTNIQHTNSQVTTDIAIPDIATPCHINMGCDEVKKISLDNQITRQLLYIESMEIREAVASIIKHQPHHLSNDLDIHTRTRFHKKFYQQLNQLIQRDPNLFYLSVWENYSSVLSQIYMAVSMSRLKSVDREIIYNKLWKAWQYITHCYQQCTRFENHVSITQTWDMQPYCEIIGPLASLRLLNELNHYTDTTTTDTTTTTITSTNSTSKYVQKNRKKNSSRSVSNDTHSSSNGDSIEIHKWLSDPSIVYHTRYNNMKQDSGHLSNLLRFRTIDIPGTHNIASKDFISNASSKNSKSSSKSSKKTTTAKTMDPFARYNPILDTLCFDPELYYMAYNTNSDKSSYQQIAASYGNPGISVVKKLNKVYKKMAST